MSTQPSNTNRQTETPAVATGTPAAKPRATRMTSANAISLAVMAFALIAVVAAVALMRRAASDAASDPTGALTPGQEASTDRDATAQPGAPASEATARAAAAEPAAPAPPAAPSPKKRPVKSAAALRSAPADAAVQAAEPHDAEESRAKTAEVDSASTTAPAAPSTDTAALSTVTITGCLEVSTDDDRFRLTDTEGVEAPKARSWRTGFLKKHSAPVDLVGTVDTATMGRQVGKRVAATGVLTSRELKVSSVRVVASSCE